jgi:hypothetical protein
MLAGTGPAAHAAAPPTRFALPSGALTLSDSELAAGARATVRFAVTLDRAVAGGRLTLTLPRLWTRRAPGGAIAYARLPAEGRATSARAAARRVGRVVTFSFSAARPGDAASFDVRDNGIPAGTYELPFRWRERGRAGRRGTARVRIVARSRGR